MHIVESYKRHPEQNSESSTQSCGYGQRDCTSEGARGSQECLVNANYQNNRCAEKTHAAVVGNVDILNLFLDPRNALVFSSDPNVCKVLVKRDGKTEELKLSSPITDVGAGPKKSSRFLCMFRFLCVTAATGHCGGLRQTASPTSKHFSSS